MFGTATTHPSQVYRSSTLAGARVLDLRIAGALLFVAGAVILLGIMSAEALYPVRYTTGANAISDLGGTEPPAGLVYQPSATIFNISMMAVGVLVMLGSALVHRGFARRAVTLPVLVLGAGALGVGMFPGNTGTPHALFAMTTFISGGVAALTAALVTSGPFRYLSILLGAISLATLAAYFALGDAAPLAELGIGGVERWIVYPIVLWVTGFGAWLAGHAEA